MYIKKFISGLVVGVCLTASASAFADDIESILGKSVDGEFPVKIDGVTLSQKAAVIEGTSYLPVRAVGNAIGRDVTFDAKSGIELKKKTNDTEAVQSENNIKAQFVSNTKTILEKEYIKENGNFYLVEIDGDQYVSAAALSVPYQITFNIPVASFEIVGKNPINVTVSDKYSKGVDSFIVDGSSVFKLSLFGLVAHIDGDTLIIEKK